MINKQNKQLSRFKTTTIIRSPLADDDVNKLLRGCCVDAFISECALPKKEENKNTKFVLSGGFFSKTTTNSEKKMFSKLMKKREK